MRTLYLHIGQGKTGTSFLQSVFALSQANLSQKNIDYPVPRASIDLLAKGIFPSGNGNALTNLFSSQGDIETFHLPKKRDILLSHEGLISRLLFEGSQELLDKICQKHHIDHVSFLAFGRNPIAHAVSSYRQLVKRSGMTLSLDEYCNHYSSPKQLSLFLNAYHQRKNTSIVALNYSECGKRLIDEVAKWLKIETDDFKMPPKSIINRSMTKGELFFQRELNKHLGDKAQLMSDPLFEKITDLENEDLIPSMKAQGILIDNMAPHMETVNAFLPEDHYYSSDIIHPHPNNADAGGKCVTPPPTKYEFTESQLKALAEVYIRVYREKNSEKSGS